MFTRKVIELVKTRRFQRRDQFETMDKIIIKKKIINCVLIRRFKLLLVMTFWVATKTSYINWLYNKFFLNTGDNIQKERDIKEKVKGEIL